MELFKKCKVVRIPTENKTVKGQYLYILSKDEIKEEEYCFHKGSKQIIKYPNGGFPKGHSLKVIASTDRSLNLLGIPESFIKEYCEKGGIDEVMVAYEDICDYDDDNPDGLPDKPIWILKTPNNTIIIKPIKESWNREEVIKLLIQYGIDVYRKGMHSGKWIEENL